MVKIQSDREKPFAYVRESRTVLDSGFHTVDSGFEVWIPLFVSGTWILNYNL